MGVSSGARQTKTVQASAVDSSARRTTGRYLGMVHIQRLLREPPHASIGGILDKDVEPLAPDATLGQVARMLATYDLVGLPIVDAEGHLLGAVTVDDVLDHILPEDWREERHDVMTPEGVRRG